MLIFIENWIFDKKSVLSKVEILIFPYRFIFNFVEKSLYNFAIKKFLCNIGTSAYCVLWHSHTITETRIHTFVTSIPVVIRCTILFLKFLVYFSFIYLTSIFLILIFLILIFLTFISLIFIFLIFFFLMFIFRSFIFPNIYFSNFHFYNIHFSNVFNLYVNLIKFLFFPFYFFHFF